MLEQSSMLYPMNKLSTEKRIQVVAALVEGNSLRSISRMTGVHRTAIMKLLVDLGNACAAYQDEHLRGLTSTKIQCDEIWSFCYAKDANLPEDKVDKFGYGMHYNFCRIHSSLRVTPAMESGVADHVWEINEIVALLG